MDFGKMNLSQAVKLACVSSAGVECNMVNFPSLLRMDDGGGAVTQGGCGVRGEDRASFGLEEELI